MRTVVIPPPGVHGLGRSRTVSVIAHPLTDADAQAVTAQLAAQGIPVTLTRGDGHRVNLWPFAPVTTRQEVQALRIVEGITDAPVAWNQAVA